MLQKGFRLEFAAEPDSIAKDIVKTPVFFFFSRCMEKCLQGRDMCSVLGNGRGQYAVHTVLGVSPLTSEKRLTLSRGLTWALGAARAQATHFP